MLNLKTVTRKDLIEIYELKFENDKKMHDEEKKDRPKMEWPSDSESSESKESEKKKKKGNDKKESKREDAGSNRNSLNDISRHSIKSTP